MKTKNRDKLRKKLIDRIKKMNPEKLSTIESYLNELESGSKDKKEILSYAGMFDDLDQEVMEELTIYLTERRALGTSRIQEEYGYSKQ